MNEQRPRALLLFSGLYRPTITTMRYGVILAGGGGTRLWPLSRRRAPKQFLNLAGGESLLANAARRLRPCCGDNLFVVTTESQSSLVHDHLPGLPTDHILAEPAARNTAAALGLAAAVIAARDSEATIGFTPSDHHIFDDEAFAVLCDRAFARAERGDAVVTLGIKPSSAHTGYGYLEVATADEAPANVVRFVEKPDRETAERYLESGRYLWNSGIFFATAAHWLDLFDEHLPAHAAYLRALTARCSEGDAAAAIAASAAEYRALEAISVDYGVMEAARSVVTFPLDFGWSDIGAWTSLADLHPSDAQGNVCVGDVVAVDSHDSILVAKDRLIAACGVSDLIVIGTADSVLVLPKSQAERVRDIQEKLVESGHEDYL